MTPASIVTQDIASQNAHQLTTEIESLKLTLQQALETQQDTLEALAILRKEHEILKSQYAKLAAAQNSGLTNEGVVAPAKGEPLTVAFSRLALAPVEGEVKKRQEQHLAGSAGDTKSSAERVALDAAELEPGSERALEAARTEQMIQEEQAKSLSKIKAKSSYVRKDRHFYFETPDLDDNDITYLSKHLKTNYPSIRELTLSRTTRYKINALATVLAENPSIHTLTLLNCVNHYAWIYDLADLIQNNKSLRTLKLMVSDEVRANIKPVLLDPLVEALCSNTSLTNIIGVDLRCLNPDRRFAPLTPYEEYQDNIFYAATTYKDYDATIKRIRDHLNLNKESAKKKDSDKPKAKP